MVGRSFSSVSVGIVILLGLALVGCPFGAGKVTEEIKVGASSYDFGATESEWSLQVWSKGDSGEPLQFEVEADKAWVGVTPGSGASDGPGDIVTATVTLARDSMTGKNAEGVYTATLTVSAANAESKTITLTARDPNAAMAVSSQSHDFGEFDSEWALEVWNSGQAGSTLTVSVSSNQPWLTATPTSVTSTGLADRQTIGVEVDRSSLSSGPHSGKLSLTAPGVTTRTITVTVLVPDAGIGLSADSYDFSYDKDAWAVQVWNAGGEGSTLQFNVASNVPWLVVTPGPGSSTGPNDKQTIAVAVDRASIVQGTYTGALTVSGDGVDSRTVNVTARAPIAKVGVSANSHHFGFVEDQWAFDVWNEGEEGSKLTFQVTSDEGWISVGPAAGISTGPENKQAVTVTVSRDKMGKDTNTNGTVQVSGVGAAPKSVIIAAGLPVAPKADFGVSMTETFVGDAVQFADKSISGTADIASWLWEFGDGATSTEQSPSHTYGAEGTYAVALTVGSEHGTDSKSAAGLVSVREKIAPKAAFLLSTSETIIGADVAFTDSSSDETAPITAWLWEFGDGDTSQGQHPHHTYDAAGTYNVKLTVTSAHGMASVTKSGAITIKTQAPKADFVAAVTTPKVNETVEFVDRSDRGTADITGWLWAFGDGTTSTQQNPTHSYSTLGTYTVALTVTTEHGTHSETKASYIELQVNPPTADFTAAPLNPDTSDVVEFTDLSTPGDAAIVAWEWNFGDSQTSTDRRPRHQYATYGTFSIMLTVTDADGNKGRRTRTDYILVEAKPAQASFTVSDNNPYRWELLQFTDTSDAGSTLITDWFWSFGDGEVSYSQNPAHIYPNEGQYTVTLTITTLLSQSTASQTINVRNVGVDAQFSVDKKVVYSGIDKLLFLDDSLVEGPHLVHESSYAAWQGDPGDWHTYSFHFLGETIAPYPADSRYVVPDNYYDRKFFPGHGLYYQFHQRGLYNVRMTHWSSGLVNPGDPYQYGNHSSWTADSMMKADFIEAREPAAMDRYIRIEEIWDEFVDDPFEYEKRATLEGDGYTAYVLRMTSQQWLLDEGFSEPTVTVPDDNEWQHWLTIVVPDNYDETKPSALLYVAGGDNADPMPTSVNGHLVDFAIGSRAVVAQVSQVPNGPIHFSDAGALQGQELIAYSMYKFLNTGDEFWPALFPMVKSTVRAMDAIEGFLGGEVFGGPWPPMRVEQFVLAGAGDRGWSTWLAGASDERVRGIIPMAFDFLNMWEQLVQMSTSISGDKYLEAWEDYETWGVLPRLLGPHPTHGWYSDYPAGSPMWMGSALENKRYQNLLKLRIREMLRDLSDLDRVDWAHVPEVQRFLAPESDEDETPYYSLVSAVSAYSGLEYSTNPGDYDEHRHVIDVIYRIRDYMDSDGDYWSSGSDYWAASPLPEGIEDWGQNIKWFHLGNVVGWNIPLYTGGSGIRYLPDPTSVYPNDYTFETVVDYMMKGEERERQGSRESWLLFMVDPDRYNARYNYLFDYYSEFGGRLNLPKYILTAAGDAYFPPDSALQYFGDLDAPKYLRTYPNTGHQLLGEEETLLSALPWFNAVIAGGTPELPFTWMFLGEGTLQVQLEGSMTPTQVNLWIAKDPASDFRIDDALRPDGPNWTKMPLNEIVSGTGEYLVNISPDQILFQAYFVELEYADPSGIPLVYTTETKVVAPTCPGCAVAPTADFDVDTRTPAVGQAVVFTDTSDPGSSPIASWHWDFGDGLTSLQQNPHHAYGAAGDYTVTLTVVSADGQDIIIRVNYINVPTP